MRIGLVYDLRDDYLAEGWTPEEAAEFDSVSTIDALDNALRFLGHEVPAESIPPVLRKETDTNDL